MIPPTKEIKQRDESPQVNISYCTEQATFYFNAIIAYLMMLVKLFEVLNQILE